MATSTDGEAVEDIIRRLPPELQAEVGDFARFLLERRRPTRSHLRLSWAGALLEFRDRYTSTELQKQSLEWWRP